MLQQITDLEAEAAELDAMLGSRPDADFERTTAFKAWTINDVLRHLHAGDSMAALSVTDTAAFQDFLADVRAKRAGGLTPRDDARQRFGHLAGSALLAAWRDKLAALCALLAARDPDARLKWSGPDMGLRMFTTARQMVSGRTARKSMMCSAATGQLRTGCATSRKSACARSVGRSPIAVCRRRARRRMCGSMRRQVGPGNGTRRR